MNTRKLLLASASVLAMTVPFAQTLQASPCITSGTITGACEGPVTMSGPLSIAPGGVVTGTILNTGTFSQTGSVVTNNGRIDGLINNGVFNFGGNASFGVFNSGTIGALTNNGSVLSLYDASHPSLFRYAIGIENTGNANIGTLSNAGEIKVIGYEDVEGIDLDGPATRIGLLTNGGIVLATANAHAAAISNFNGSIGTLINETAGTISALSADASGINNSRSQNAATIGTIINNGLISVVAVYDKTYPTQYTPKHAYGIFNNGVVDVLTNNGTISAAATDSFDEAFGISNRRATTSLTSGSASGLIGTLVNTGLISGVRAIENRGDDHEGASIGLLRNEGTILSVIPGTIRNEGYGIDNGGTIGTLVNTGTIAALCDRDTCLGIASDGGSIGTLINAGLISAVSGGSNVWGIVSWSTPIGQLTNSGSITVSGTSAIAIKADDLTAGIGVLTNSGVISATGTSTAYGIFLGGHCGAPCGSTIGSLNNSGTMTASAASAIVVYNGAGSSIGTFVNDGVIKVAGLAGSSGPQYDVVNVGSIGALTNNGVIGGDARIGIVNIGVGSSLAGTVYQQNSTISTLLNVGVITGSEVGISNGGQINVLSNTGAVAAVGNGAVRGIYNSGSITNLSNGGQITATGQDAIGIWNDRGSIASFVNDGLVRSGSGTVLGGATAIWNYGGTIDSLTNNGTIAADGSGNSLGIYNNNSGTLISRIGTLTNGGTIAVSGKTSAAIYNDSGAVITKLVNTGALSADPVEPTSYVIQNWGTIGAITNSGTIQGANAITSTGTLGTITNSGVISGNVTSATDLVIAGGTTTAGTFKNGTISAPSVSFTGGSLTLADNVVVGNGSGTVTNTGATVNVASAVSITGNYTQTAGSLHFIDSGELLVSGQANLSGGTVALASTVNYLAGATVTLVGAASGSSYNGVTVTLTGVNATADTTSTKDLVITVANNYVGGTIGTVSNGGIMNSGTVGGIVVGQTGTVGSASNAGTIISENISVDNSGQLGTFTNTGVLSSGNVGVGNLGSIGTLANTGTITGTNSVVSNSGTLGTLTNGGLLSGSGTGLSNTGIIGTIGNSGTIAMSGGAFGLANSGTVGGVTNDGTITGGERDVYNQGTMGSLVNNGHIGSTYAVYVDTLGNLGQFVNAGNIEGTIASFYNAGTVGAISNSGTITGDGLDGIFNHGTLGLISNSGTITGTGYAIRSNGVMGPIVNTGLVIGNVSATNPLSISGGTSGFGTFTGGTITAPSVSFTAGNIRLGDAVNVGDGTVSASGATIEVANRIAITGNYVQTGGTLISDVASTTAFGQLAVSGSATISGATIAVSGSSVKAGQTYTIVDASAASSYSGDTVKVVGAHYKAILSATSDDLIATIRPLFSDIGKAKGGDAETMGKVLEGLGDVAAMQKSIDTLSNLSDDDLGVALVQAAPAQVGNSQATLRRAVLTSGLVGDAIERRVGGIDRNISGSTTWFSVLGGYTSRDASGGTQGYDTTAVGVVAGWDHLAADGLRLGVAASWTDARNTAQGVVSANFNRADSYQLTGYAAWFEGPWSLNTRALVGYDTYKQRRVMSYIGETATGDYAGYHYGWSAEGGYAYNLGNLSITPTAAFNWLRVSVNSYTESGANTENLSLPSYFSDSVEGLLGIKFGATYQSQFATFQPEVKLSWVHDFAGGRAATRAGLGGTSFEVLADPIAKDGVKVGAGLSMFHDSGVSVWIGYDGDLRSDYRAHTGDIRIQYRF